PPSKRPWNLARSGSRRTASRGGAWPPARTRGSRPCARASHRGAASRSAGSRPAARGSGTGRSCPASRTPARAGADPSAGRARPRVVQAVARDGGGAPGPAVTADGQPAAALRPAQPLVAVRRPVRGAERLDVDGHLAGGVGRVDERVDAEPVELADDRVDRED